MTPEDLKQYCGFNHVEAYRIFNELDFPLTNPHHKRGKRVGKYALRQWLNRGTIPSSNQEPRDVPDIGQQVIDVCKIILKALGTNDAGKKK